MRQTNRSGQRLRRAAAAAGGILTVAAAVGAQPARAPGDEFDLARYRYKNRLLLLFAPSARDSSYAAELSAFRARRAGADDRELIRISVLESGASDVDGCRLAPADAAALRRRYQAPAGRFTVVLVGKDGHAALRSERPVVAGRLFPAIDAMPMRREEVRRRGGTG